MKALLGLLLAAVVGAASTVSAQQFASGVPRPPALLLSPEQETQAALDDYNRQPPELQVYTRYLTLRHVPENMKTMWEKVLQFIVPSTSREVNLDDLIPVRVPGTDLYRINLLSLGWNVDDFVQFVADATPYTDTANPLTLRGDWLAVYISDCRESQAYYALLYGSANIPKTRQEMFAFFKVREDQQAKLGFGLIGQDSPVSITGERWIEHWALDGGYAWQTLDVKKIKDGKGPLDSPDGKFAFDGSEMILGLPKVSARFRSRGALQVYQLGNSAEARVEEAPGDLVRDYIGYKHSQIIVNSISCHQCHAGGINDPQTNGLEKAIIDGIELSASYDQQQFIERFHLTDVGKEIRRNQEDFATAVYACNQLQPKDNALYLRGAINWYNRELNLAQAAHELNSTERELQLALSYASAKNLDVGVRFAGLAHGRTVTRDTLESGYLKLREIVKIWRSR